MTLNKFVMGFRFTALFRNEIDFKDGIENQGQISQFTPPSPCKI